MFYRPAAGRSCNARGRSRRQRAAFHVFHDAWYAQVQRWSQARIARPELIGAEDLVVATFWKAWQWIAGPSSLPEPDVLLRTCLDRAHTDLLRAAYGRAAVDARQLPRRGADARDPLSLDRVSPDTQALIEALADSYDVEEVVLEAAEMREHLAALPPLDRACVRCRHLEGRSVAATAAYLSLTPDQVKKHTAHGLALLTRRLLAAGPPPAPGAWREVRHACSRRRDYLAVSGRAPRGHGAASSGIPGRVSRSPTVHRRRAGAGAGNDAPHRAGGCCCRAAAGELAADRSTAGRRTAPHASGPGAGTRLRRYSARGFLATKNRGNSPPYTTPTDRTIVPLARTPGCWCDSDRRCSVCPGTAGNSKIGAASQQSASVHRHAATNSAPAQAPAEEQTLPQALAGPIATVTAGPYTVAVDVLAADGSVIMLGLRLMNRPPDPGNCASAIGGGHHA